MADEVKESKDKRRSRFNREGKEFLKNGQNHLVTPQHQTAMDYFGRKDGGKNERRRVEAGTGQGSRTMAAAGDSVKAAGTASLPVPAAQRDKVFKKLSKVISERGQEDPSFAGRANILSPKKRLNRLGAINEGNVHHAAMATIADILSEKQEEAEVHGILHSRDTKSIDNSLTQAYKSLHHSEYAHDTGQVNDAKVHMASAHTNLHDVATQLQNKGVDVHPDTIRALKTTAEGYIKSTRPGEGAMPHPGFRPPKERSATVRLDPDDIKPGPNARKVSGKPLSSSVDNSWTEDESDGVNNNDTPGLVGRQLESYLPVKSPKYVKGN